MTEQSDDPTSTGRWPFTVEAGTRLPRPGGPVLLVIGLVVVVLGGFELLKGTLPVVENEAPPSLCLLKRTTGVPCPTCGSTRAVKAAARGDLLQAFDHNPLIFTGLSLCGVVLLIRLCTGVTIRPQLTSTGWALLGVMFVLLLLANWWWVLRSDGFLG